MAHSVSWARIYRTLREAMLPLAFYAIMTIPAGGIFSRMEEEIQKLPGLLMMIPAIMNTRGSISSTYGAKLSTGYHLGIITPEAGLNDEVMENVKATLSLSMFVSVIRAIFAYVLSVVVGIPHISFLHFLEISVGIGILSDLVMVSFTYFIVLTSVRMGMDPNNVTIPTITTIGDIVTLSISLVIAKLVALHGGFL